MTSQNYRILNHDCLIVEETPRRAKLRCVCCQPKDQLIISLTKAMLGMVCGRQVAEIAGIDFGPPDHFAIDVVATRQMADSRYGDVRQARTAGWSLDQAGRYQKFLTQLSEANVARLEGSLLRIRVPYHLDQHRLTVWGPGHALRADAELARIQGGD